MLEGLFTITPTPPSSLRIEVFQSGTFSFTLTSLAAPGASKELILQPLLVTPYGKDEVDWLAPVPGRYVTMSGGETKTVGILASPNASSPLGASTLALAIADKANPNDVFLYSSPVTCEVIGKPSVVSQRSRLPRWLIPVIAGAVLVVGGATVGIWRLARSDCVATAGEPCGDCSGTIQCDGSCSNTTPLCPAGFAADPNEPTKCRSVEAIALGTWPIVAPVRACHPDFQVPFPLPCGVGRVRANARITTVGPAPCTVEFKRTDPADCSVVTHFNDARMGGRAAQRSATSP